MEQLLVLEIGVLFRFDAFRKPTERLDGLFLEFRWRSTWQEYRWERVNLVFKSSTWIVWDCCKVGLAPSLHILFKHHKQLIMKHVRKESEQSPSFPTALLFTFSQHRPRKNQNDQVEKRKVSHEEYIITKMKFLCDK